MRKTIATYQRLLKHIIVDLGNLQPGSDPKLRDELNRKFRKYQTKIDLYAGK